MGKNKSENEIIAAIKPEKLKEMADQIDNFLDFVDKFLFIEGCTNDEYEKYMKKARKAAKRLRKGKDLDSVFDAEKIEECCQNDPNFASEYLDEDW